jgi:hypothetical protein
MTTAPVVFLVDVDNTLLDNDRIQDDLKRHLEREFGATSRDRYWAILEALFVELGYRDYLGALQRYRVEHPQDVRLMAMSSYLKDAWGDRVTTIFPRQGQYGGDAEAYRAADLTVERIGDLVTHDLSQLLSLEVPR